MNMPKILLKLLGSAIVVFIAFAELRISPASWILPQGMAGLFVFILAVFFLTYLISEWSSGKTLIFLLTLLGVELLFVPLLFYYSRSSSLFLRTFSIIFFEYSIIIAVIGLFLLIVVALLLLRTSGHKKY